MYACLCDRCGKRIDEPELSIYLTVEPPNSSEKIELDLCEDCYSEFATDFIKLGKED